MDTDPYQERLKRAAGFLQAQLGEPPGTALVLGSGLGDFVDALPAYASLAYGEIPGFPVSDVIGHSGKLTHSGGRGVPFCALQGRSHFYEGLPQSELVFAVRSLALWGVRDFVITNAAGAICRDFSPGDLVVISDHINLSGDNPLVGPNLDALGERFSDMTHAYHPDLREAALEAGRELGLEVKQGVYVCVKGPSYETPAEIRMLSALGADVVGMSTVPEVISLNHMRCRVVGISCITNMAAGILSQPLEHDQVLEMTRRARKDFENLLLAFLERVSEID